MDKPGPRHHVMIRGIKGHNIFLGDEDREDFASRVGELRIKDWLSFRDGGIGECDSDSQKRARDINWSRHT